MNNLILVRHGQSLWNLERRFTGWADIDLTGKGKTEAEFAGQLIKKLNLEFHTYFTSELKRAINSLNIILKVLNKPEAKVIKSFKLNERHYGDLTGLNKDETIKKYGFEQVKKWRRSFDTRPPKMSSHHLYKKIIKTNIAGESLKDTLQRVEPFYNENIKPLIDLKKNVLIIFHGNSCRALLMKIFNISKEKIVDFEIPTGNPLLIRFKNDLKIKDFRYLDKKRSKKIPYSF